MKDHDDSPKKEKKIIVGFWECSCGSYGTADDLDSAINRGETHAAYHTAKGHASVTILVRTKTSTSTYARVVQSEEVRIRVEAEKRRSLPPLNIAATDHLLRAIFRPIGRARRLASATLFLFGVVLMSAHHHGRSWRVGLMDTPTSYCEVL